MRQSLSMSTLQDVKQAEKRMEAARKALFAYLELPKQQEIDVKLRTHLADPDVRLGDIDVEPLADQGFSGNQISRVRAGWIGPHGSPGAATWVLKRWLPAHIVAR